MIVRPEFEKFLTIYEEKSLSRAADRLDAYQGALSKVLAKLEAELSSKLFVRSNRGLVPTPSGHKLYSQIRQQIELWNAYSDHQKGAGDEPSGPLRVGGHPAVILQFTKQIAALKFKYSSLNLQIQLGRSPEITRSVLNHEIDLAIVANPTRFNELIIKPLKNEDVGIFSSGPSANKEILIYNPELISSNSLLKKQKKSTQLVAVSDYEVAASLAKNLKATALLPQSVAHRHSLNIEIGKPLFVAEMSLIYRADHLFATGLTKIVRELQRGSS